MEIEVSLIKPSQAVRMQQMLSIRKEVFVIEQNVSPELEYDEFEEDANFYLANYKGKPAGTSRWRFTPKGIKLERFAVLKAYRSKGVGSALLAKMIEEIEARPDAEDLPMYLHAQLTALPLYEKFGFKTKGDIFVEADIEHYYMYR